MKETGLKIEYPGPMSGPQSFQFLQEMTFATTTTAGSLGPSRLRSQGLASGRVTSVLSFGRFTAARLEIAECCHLRRRLPAGSKYLPVPVQNHHRNVLVLETQPDIVRVGRRKHVRRALAQ